MDGSEDVGFAPQTHTVSWWMEDEVGGREGGRRSPPILHLQKGANEAGSPPRHAAGWKAVLELHTWAFPAGERPAAFTNSSRAGKSP